MRDIHIFDTTYGGEVTKDLATRDGLESAVYLSLFGGNRGDDGRQKNPMTWWGNLSTQDLAKHYRGEAAELLATVVPTSANLRRIEDATARDLAWLKSGGFARVVEISASMPALRKVNLVINIDELDPLAFSLDWGPVTQPDLLREIEPPFVQVNGPHTLTGTSLRYGKVYFVRADGSEVWAEMDEYGNFIFDPYPLAEREVVLAYTTTGTGLTSHSTRIVGGVPLLFDGSWSYDGSQEYDGIKNE